MIRNYLLTRTNLLTVFLLVDIRHEPQANDLEFMEWLAVSQIPFTMVFTKSDKLKLSQKNEKITAYKNRLAKDWVELPAIITTSSSDKTGREDLLKFIEETNKIF